MRILFKKCPAPGHFFEREIQDSLKSIRSFALFPILLENKEFATIFSVCKAHFPRANCWNVKSKASKNPAANMPRPRAFFACFNLVKSTLRVLFTRLTNLSTSTYYPYLPHTSPAALDYSSCTHEATFSVLLQYFQTYLATPVETVLLSHESKKR